MAAYTVAAIGSDTRDAPALKQANVGFGVGLTGTDVAKEAVSFSYVHVCVCVCVCVM